MLSQSKRMSLRFKALAAIFSISLLSLISIGFSLWFATVTETDAAAINIAGSLRMQSWRLAEQVIIPELTSREALYRLIDIYDKSISSHPLDSLEGLNNGVELSYQKVLVDWHQRMRPMLLDPDFYSQYVDAVPSFVDSIDGLVIALQHNTESKLRLLFIVAVVMLCSILFIAIISIRFIRLQLLKPIDELTAAADRVRNGEFDLQLQYKPANELGRFSQTFSLMAKDLSRLYGDLEGQVGKQTRALARSNSALQLLYNASQSLGENPYDENRLRELVDQWKKLLKLDRCFICLTGMADSPRLQRIVPYSDLSFQSCNTNSCLECVSQLNSDCAAKNKSALKFELKIKDQAFGFIYAAEASASQLNDESRQWLETFADIVATALYKSAVKTQERRLLLMEERAVIARELHDSLAQALSYQKIQVARLKRVLTKSRDDNINAGPQERILQELHEGINSAYRQLRELLNTFRLSMAEASLEEALTNTLKECRQRSPGIEFQIDYQLRYCKLDAHHEIHILQIVREALVNVIRHANANRALVSCQQDDDQKITVLIDDDGQGMPDINDGAGHYGMTIMQERARSMGGNLEFRKAPEGGTRVFLEFRTA